jgi:GAF domain-containing protein
VSGRECSNLLCDGEVYRLEADNGFSPEYQEYVRRNPIAPGRGTLVARTALEVATVHIPDVLADPEYTWREGQRLGRFRAMLGVPLLRDGSCIGVMAMTRSIPQPFTSNQIELITTFADQAVIAIENTRLFEAEQARTREVTERTRELTEAQGQWHPAVPVTDHDEEVGRRVALRCTHLAKADLRRALVELRLLVDAHLRSTSWNW